MLSPVLGIASGRILAATYSRMRWIPSHKTLIIVATLWWIFSFFAETAYLQPFSTPGLYAAPVLMILGIIRFPFYQHRRITTRRSLLAAWRSDPENLPQPDIRDPNFVIWIILGFWTFCICIWMAGFWAFHDGDEEQQKAMAVVRSACAGDSVVLHKTGGITGFGLLSGGTIRSRNGIDSAKLSFTIVGKDHNLPGEAELIRRNGPWQLIRLETHRPR